MSLDEQELRRQLGSVLEAVTPPPAPVRAAVHQGRVIRIRRRAGVAAGLAVAVGLAVTLPSVLHQATPAPVSPPPPSVTVTPLGATAKNGVIGSGKIGRVRWRMVVQAPGTHGAGKGNQCFVATVGTAGAAECGSLSVSGGDPATFSSTSDAYDQTQYAVVSDAVARVAVTLADGAVLVLHPVAAYGQRYVAFATPTSLAVSRVVVYSDRGEIDYAVPYHSGSGTQIESWLRPGQRGLPRATYRIGSGNTDGRAWAETVHVGPWGYCFAGPQPGCLATQARSFGSRVQFISGGGAGTTGYAAGMASAAVSRVRVTLSGGRSETVRVANGGGARFYAFAIPKGATLVRVTYLAASGRVVASQSESQVY